MKIPGLRWIIAAMLFLATMINYADRMALSIVSADLRREFAMTEQDYSYMVTAFLAAYAIMYAGSGYVVDRLGTRRGFAVFIFVWSVAAMLHGLATGLWSFGFYRFLLGLGEPGNWPAAAKAIAEWFPTRMRALGVGIFNAGSSMGSAIAPPAVAYLTLHYGWRFAFIFIGGMGLVWLVAWLVLYDPPHRNRWLSERDYLAMKHEIQAPDDTPATRGTPVDWKQVIRVRACYTLIVARFFTDPVVYFIIFWLPEYLRKERGFDLAMVGKYAWVPFIFGGVGYIFGGWLSGFLMGRGWTLERARKSSMALGAAVMPMLVFAPLVPSAGLAIAATCCAAFGHAVWVANLQTLPTDLFKGQEVGTSSGFSGMGGAVGGMLANLGTGWIVTHFSYAPVFLMAGLMHPLSCAIVYAMMPASYFRRRAAELVTPR